jgi:hypothetical protein
MKGASEIAFSRNIMTRFRLSRLAWGLILLAFLGLSTACDRVDRQGGGAANIELMGPLVPPPVGEGRILLRVTDRAGAPIDNARLTVRGDMTHAGMIPIVGTADRGEDGLYMIPVEWTMAGDWIITAEATLSDDSLVSRQFELSVSTREELCTDYK